VDREGKIWRGCWAVLFLSLNRRGSPPVKRWSLIFPFYFVTLVPLRHWGNETQLTDWNTASGKSLYPGRRAAPRKPSRALCCAINREAGAVSLCAFESAEKQIQEWVRQ